MTLIWVLVADVLKLSVGAAVSSEGGMREGLLPSSPTWLFHGSLSINSQHGSCLVSGKVSKRTRKSSLKRSQGLFVT